MRTKSIRTARYEAVALAKPKRGFNAMVIDHQHPSGASAVTIRWFKTMTEACAYIQPRARTVA